MPLFWPLEELAGNAVDQAKKRFDALTESTRNMLTEPVLLGHARREFDRATNPIMSSIQQLGQGVDDTISTARQQFDQLTADLGRGWERAQQSQRETDQIMNQPGVGSGAPATAGQETGPAGFTLPTTGTEEGARQIGALSETAMRNTPGGTAVTAAARSMGAGPMTADTPVENVMGMAQLASNLRPIVPAARGLMEALPGGGTSVLEGMPLPGGNRLASDTPLLGGLTTPDEVIPQATAFIGPDPIDELVGMGAGALRSGANALRGTPRPTTQARLAGAASGIVDDLSGVPSLPARSMMDRVERATKGIGGPLFRSANTYNERVADTTLGALGGVLGAAAPGEDATWQERLESGLTGAALATGFGPAGRGVARYGGMIARNLPDWTGALARINRLGIAAGEDAGEFLEDDVVGEIGRLQPLIQRRLNRHQELTDAIGRLQQEMSLRAETISGPSIERPPTKGMWAGTGRFSEQDLVEIAERSELSPYTPQWYDAVDPATIRDYKANAASRQGPRPLTPRQRLAEDRKTLREHQRQLKLVEGALTEDMNRVATLEERAARAGIALPDLEPPTTGVGDAPSAATDVQRPPRPDIRPEDPGATPRARSAADEALAVRHNPNMSGQDKATAIRAIYDRHPDLTPEEKAFLREQATGRIRPALPTQRTNADLASSLPPQLEQRMQQAPLVPRTPAEPIGPPLSGYGAEQQQPVPGMGVPPQAPVSDPRRIISPTAASAPLPTGRERQSSLPDLATPPPPSPPRVPRNPATMMPQGPEPDPLGRLPTDIGEATPAVNTGQIQRQQALEAQQTQALVEREGQIQTRLNQPGDPALALPQQRLLLPNDPNVPNSGALASQGNALPASQQAVAQQAAAQAGVPFSALPTQGNLYVPTGNALAPIGSPQHGKAMQTFKAWANNLNKFRYAANLLSGTSGAIGDVVTNVFNIPRLYFRTAAGAGYESIGQVLGRIDPADRATTFSQIKGLNDGWSQGAGQAVKQAFDVILNGTPAPIATDVTGSLVRGRRGIPLELAYRIRLAADAFTTNLGEKMSSASLGYREADRAGLKAGTPQHAQYAADVTKRIQQQMETMIKTAQTAGQRPQQGGVAQRLRNPNIAGDKADIEALAKEAIGMSRRMAFQQDVGAATKAIGTTREGGGLMSWIIPFFRTTATIAAEGVTGHPIGALATGIDVATGRAGIQRSPYAVAQQAVGAGATGLMSREGTVFTRSNTSAVLPASQRLADATLGAMIASLGAVAVANGVMTGTGPADASVRRKMMDEGWRPLAIQTSNGYIPLARLLGPLAFPLSFGVAAQELRMKGGSLDGDTISKFVDSQINQYGQSSGLQDFYNVLNIMFTPDPEERWRAVERVAAGALSQWFVPFGGIARQINQITDPAIRDPRNIPQRLLANYPYFSGMVPERTNETGDPLRRGPGEGYIRGELEQGNWGGAALALPRSFLPGQETQRNEGIRQYFGSESAESDAEIRAAINAVENFRRHPDQYAGPNERQWELYNTYNRLQNTVSAQLRSQERARRRQREADRSAQYWGQGGGGLPSFIPPTVG